MSRPLPELNPDDFPAHVLGRRNGTANGSTTRMDELEAAIRKLADNDRVFETQLKKTQRAIKSKGWTGPETDQEDTAPDPSAFKPIDWDDLFSQDFSGIEFLPGGFVEPGQQIALIGDGKVGKSVFGLDWSHKVVTGQKFLGDAVARKPLRILYLDKENNQRDILMRLRSMGATPNQLRNLIYESFPPFAPLNTTAGVTQLMDLVDKHAPDIVIIDTISRFIEGKENESDTWLALYRLMHERLKAKNITGVRLDHFGKDAERGGRGSSAKSQDIDHVWELTRIGEPDERRFGDQIGVTAHLTLKRTHTRTGLGPGRLDLVRRGVLNSDRTEWLPGESRHEIKGRAPGVDPFVIDASIDPAERTRVKAIYAALANGGLNTNKIVEATGQRKEDIGKTLRMLSDAAYLSAADGPRSSKIYKIVREFDHGE